jgi:hypothetical protein
MLMMKIKPYVAVLARLIKKSCKGAGTNELLLTCTIIRYKGILKEIQIAFPDCFYRGVWRNDSRSFAKRSWRRLPKTAHVYFGKREVKNDFICAPLKNSYDS